MKEAYNIQKETQKVTGIYIAKVVNNKDPKKRGRVRVRIVGITGADIPDSKCPWAEQMTPILSSTKDITGISSVPDKGVYVYIQFLYDDPAFPIYTGICRGKKDSSPIFKKEGGSVFEKKRKSTKIPDEPESTSLNVKYPLCNVIETKEHNTIILDDTPGNVRIVFGHGKSGGYIEIRDSGDIVIKSSKHKWDLTKSNRTTKVCGHDYTKVKEYRKTEILKDDTTTVDGNVTLKVKGNLTFDVDGTITFSGKNSMNLNSNGIIKSSGTAISLNGSNPNAVTSNGKAITRTGDKDTDGDTNLPPM